MSVDPEFYVGYLPEAPSGLGRLIAKVTATLCTVGAMVAQSCSSRSRLSRRARLSFSSTASM
jgi:hypothetical protein